MTGALRSHAFVAVLAMIAASLVALPTASGAVETATTGQLDGSSGPAYAAFEQTFDQSGPVTVSAEWTGAGQLDLFVKDGASTVASSATAAMPEQATVEVEAGTTLTFVLKATDGPTDWTLVTDDEPSVLLGTADAGSQAWRTHEVAVDEAGWLDAVLATEDDADLELFLTDDDGSIVASSQTTVATEQLSHRVEPGTYLLKAHAASGAAAWRLSTELESGADVGLVGTSDPAGSRYRTYPVTMADPGLLTARLDWPGSGDMSLWIRDEAGAVLETGKFDGAQPEMLSREVPAGDYEVVAAATDAATAFTLDVGQQTGEDRSWIGNIGFDYVGDGPRQVYDSFDLQVPADATVAVALDELADDDADLDLYVRHLQDGGATPMVDYSTTGLDPERATFTTDEAGTYRVYVKATSGASGFVLDADVQTGDDVTLAGTVQAIGGRQYRTYPVQVAAAGTLDASLDWSDAAADLDLYLRDDDGQIVASASGPGAPTEDVSFDVVPGTWQLTIKAQTGASPFTVDVATSGSSDNTAPVVDQQADVTVDEDTEIEAIQLSASDDDGDDLTFDVTGLPAGLSADAAGLVTGTPTLPGDFEVTATANDGTADSAPMTFSITVDDVNDLPELDPIDDVTATEDVALDPSIQPSASDEDGDDLDWFVSGLPLGLAQNPGTGEITGTPTVPGTHDVDVFAQDGDGSSNTETFTITVDNVNDVPVLDPIEDATGTEDEALADIQATATDGDVAEGVTESLSYSASGLPDGVTIDESTGLIAGTPTVAGTFPVDVTVADLDGASDTVTFTLDIANVNDAPVVDELGDVTVVEDAAITPIPVTGTDEDGDDLAFTVTDLPDGLSHDDSAGEVTGTPTTAGTTTVTVVANDGTVDSAPVTFDITVSEVNDPPVMDDQDDVVLDEDAPASIQLGATDEENPESITFVLGAGPLPEGLALDPLSGEISGTPTVPGEHPVEVQASDGQELSEPVAFTITVDPVNDTPVVDPLPDVTTDEDAPISDITLAATDEEGDDVTFTVTGLPEGVEFDGTDLISGTPTLPGDSTVEVVANDGTDDSLAETFTLSVTPVNDAPVAEDATFDVSEDAPVDTVVGAVSAADEDDVDLTFAIAGGNDAGDLALDEATGELTVARELDFATTAQYVVDVEVADDDGATDTATITVDVTDVVEVDPCTPISTLDCTDLAVDTPFALTFDGTEGGLADTGFTLVDAPSSRDDVDQAPAPASPTFPDVPGYEPGLLTVDGGTLTIDATKGIQYATPDPVDGQQTSGTAGINAQLNGLGVAVAGGADGYELTTSLVAPAFDVPSGGSQQAGLWWFVDEDTYVKLVVVRVTNTTNRVQLGVESLDDPTADDADGFFEVNGPTFGDGQDVDLRMAVDAVSGAVTGFYSVDGGAEQQVDDGTLDGLLLSDALMDGVALDEDLAPTVNAGVFATKRSAPASADVSATFAEFSVDAADVNEAPEITPIADVSAIEGEAIDVIDVVATDADGDDLAVTVDGLPAGVTFDDVASTISGTPDAGTAGSHEVTVTADDGTTTTEATFTITVTDPGADFTANVNFNSETGEQPDGYERDFGMAYGDRGNGLSYGWVEAADGATPLDLTGGTSGNGRDRGTAQPDQRLDSLVHMQADDITADGDTFSGVDVEGVWELAVPNGTYEVTVAAGDPSANNYANDPEEHALNVEGTPAIAPFVPVGTDGADGQHETATVTVEVGDGLLTIDADGGTNTKIDFVDVAQVAEAGNTPPTVTPIADRTATVGLALDPTIQVVADDADDDVLTYTAAGLPDGVAIDQSFGEIGGTPTESGTFNVVVTVDDGTDSVQEGFVLTVEDAVPCHDISTLPCQTVSVELPWAVDFDGSEGGLVDADGDGTGFTMAQAPSNTESVDPDPTIPEVPGHVADQLDVAAGALTIGATNGLAYASLSGGTSTSTNVNSQQNTLGVGFDAAAGPFTLETTVDVDFPGNDDFQQAGLWFGLDEDNYVKVVARETAAADTMAFEILREIDSDVAGSDSIVTSTVPEGPVTLSLAVDPADGSLVATYDLEGGASGDIGTLSGTPQAFFDGVALPDGESGSASFGGVFASARRASEADRIDATFSGFSIDGDTSTGGNTAPEVLLTGDRTLFVDQGTIIPVGTFDEDGDPVAVSVTGLPDGLTFNGTDIAGTVAPAALAGSPFTVEVTGDDGTDTDVESFQIDVVDEVAVDVNFQAEDAAVPTGAVKDFGEAYGARTGADQGTGLTYGWVAQGTTDPLSLVGNARDRDRASGPAASDQRLDTLIHMQYGDIGDVYDGTPDCTANQCDEGAWELAVPDGLYEVTLSVGDQPGGGDVYDSLHAINVETGLAILEFQADAGQEYLEVTAQAGVTDGRLTIDAVGGANTKLNHVQVRSLGTQPFATQMIPPNRATDVAIDSAVSASVSVPGTGVGVDPDRDTSLTDAAVKLFELTPTGEVEVTGNRGSTGGNDTIAFSAQPALEYDTTYRYVVDGVRDEAGNVFGRFESTFTTAPDDGSIGEPGTFEPVEGVDFEKVLLPEASGSDNGRFIASMQVHQGHLWYTTVGQGMFRHEILPDGTLGPQEDLGVLAGRAAIGLVFDQDDPDLAWVTHATANVSNESARIGSKVSTVDFSDVQDPVVQDIFVNLPRSQKDHLSNSIIHGPTGDGGGDWLYFLQGSNQAAGDTDGAWGNRGETQLTAALLRFDPQDVLAEVDANGPIDVATPEVGGSYDPFAGDAPLEVYATGIRNAYDLVWHSNGHIYVPTNGTAAGGSSPGVTNVGGEWIMQSADPRNAQTGYDQGTNVTDECATRRADGAWTGGDVTSHTGLPTQLDYVFDVEPGGYYGHPNPTRCEWVVNNGSDSLSGTGNFYPDGTDADPNYDVDGAYSLDFNKSPNGVIEYQSETFGGAMEGRVLVVRFSNNDDLLTMQVAGDGTILGEQAGTTIGGFSGGYADPLEVIEDTSVNPGNLYLNQYNRAGEPQQLYLLRVPDGQQAATVAVDDNQPLPTTDALVMSATLNDEGPTDTHTVTVSNDGTEPVDVAGTVTGTDAGQFALGSVGTVPAGGSVDVDVTFDPTGSSVGTRTATLAFTTPDGSTTLDVRALAHAGQEGGEEPTLQQVFDTLETGLDSGWSGLAGGTDPAPVGDEVDLDLFERASDGPVVVTPVAAFAPFEDLPFGWYAETTGTPTFNELGVLPDGQQQTLVPESSPAAPLEFDPGTDAFGFYYDSNTFGRKGLTEDARNLDEPDNQGISHRARVYPLPGDAFYVAFEDAANGDYQDYDFILENVVAAGADPDPDPDPDPIGDTLLVNFQAQGAPVPTDALADWGQPYGARSGADQGDGLTYGWVEQGDTSSPLDLVGNGRDRDLNDDQLLDTLMHMQLPQESDGGVLSEGTWQLAVADGTYDVTVSVGDAQNGSAPESHTVTVEGVDLVDGFPKSTAANGSDERHTTGSAAVEVTDGTLTVDAIGGTNTKINWLEVTPVGTGGGGETVAQVNFQPAGSSTPVDWEADSGELFSAGRGYGWVGTEGGAPKLDDTRDRAADTDPLDGTLVIVDDGQVGDVVDGDWEYALADGTYEVTVSVGDPEYADSTHGVTAEGTSLVSGFTPTGAGDYQVGSALVEVTDGALTLSSSGTNTKIQWVTIASTGGGDVIPPQVDIALDGPGSGGAYTGPVTVTLDISDASLEFVDVFVDGVQDDSINATNHDTPFEVSGTGEHTVEVVATDGAGNETTESTDFTIIETGDGELTLTNPEAAPFDDRLVMSRLQSDVQDPKVSDVATVALGNDGTEDLVVTDLAIADGDQFELVSPPSLPFTIPVGDSVDVDVLFDAVGSGNNQLFESTLAVTHDGNNGPTTQVELAGQWQARAEGGTEPDVAEIVATYGFGTTIVGPGDQLNNQGRLEAIGDEVLSRTWSQADDGEPITVRQLAAYHSCCNNTATFKWHQVGTKGAQTNVLTHDGEFAQTLRPRINGSDTNPAVATFDPAPDEFSISIDPESSDWTLNNTAPDSCGAGNAGCQLGHHLRFWPSEDREGERIPNQWIVVMDYSGINYDFNDNVYLVDNLQPTGVIVPGPPADPTGLAASLEGSAVRLDWDANTDDDLDGYHVERAVEGGEFERITGSPVGSATYLDTTAPAESTVQYRVVAVDQAEEESGPSDAVSVDTPTFTQPTIRINAGGPEVDHQGVTWEADNAFVGGKSFANTSATVPTLYQSERSATANLQPFDYAIDVANGTWTVNLHFAEIWFGATGGGVGGDGGERVFSADLEGGQVELADYDINADVGPETPVVQSFEVEVTDGVLDIAFTASTNQPKVSAIELVPGGSQ